MEARDDYTHYGLLNWGGFVRRGWDDGPLEQPQASSWHGQVTNRSDSNFPEAPACIDDDSAERFQVSMTRCEKKDLETYWILTWFYRDGWDVGETKRARNRFWRHL
jgi:hypothetical protein